jgi:hypothetical protein
MPTTTYKFSVNAKNHKEIVSIAEEKINAYTGPTTSHNLTYEIIVEDGTDNKTYTAQVIARIKDEYR